MKHTLWMVILFGLKTSFSNAQLLVSDFETFSLSPNSFYLDTNSTPFSVSNATFRHNCQKFGSWLWLGGFSYTNKYDSSTASYSNLYGVKAYKGYNASGTYLIGQDRGVVVLASQQNTVEGFYITNTTYAYKAIKNGNGFARKFGDTTGTGSGTTIAQGAYPDYFKITLKGYKSGAMKSDSVEFYLADFRSSNSNLDYIVDTWQWVNTSVLGEIDSLRFFMYSSDVGQFGINTPLFFGLDNFTTRGVILGLNEQYVENSLSVYPNPFYDHLYLSLTKNVQTQILIFDLNGKQLFERETAGEGQLQIDLSEFPHGVYTLKCISGQEVRIKKLIKN